MEDPVVAEALKRSLDEQHYDPELESALAMSRNEDPDEQLERALKESRVPAEKGDSEIPSGISRRA